MQQAKWYTFNQWDEQVYEVPSVTRRQKFRSHCKRQLLPLQPQRLPSRTVRLGCCIPPTQRVSLGNICLIPLFLSPERSLNPFSRPKTLSFLQGIQVHA